MVSVMIVVEKCRLFSISKKSRRNEEKKEKRKKKRKTPECTDMNSKRNYYEDRHITLKQRVWRKKKILFTTYLLLHLQAIHYRRKLAQDLVGLFVEFELGGDQIGEVAQRLRRIEDLF